jgi:hypothetical protein
LFGLLCIRHFIEQLLGRIEVDLITKGATMSYLVDNITRTRRNTGDGY